jgi:hypothetical protein
MVKGKLMNQQKSILFQMLKSGSITLREAMVDLSVQSLTGQVANLRKKGFNIKSEVKKHPVTGQQYTRYHLKDVTKARKYLNLV